MTTSEHVHLVGIGGSGLSAIATVLLEQGYFVSGSDLYASAATRELARRGALIYEGHSAANLGDAVDVVVMSSAVPGDNPELLEATRRGIPIVKRAEWLGRMMAGKRGVAVAGTHGKTSTTAMIALIIREAGLDPTFIVGGTVQQLGTSAAAGTGDAFVIEADEYDRTFLGLSPEIAVVTILEWDHPDCYPTPESMVEAFRQFVDLVPAGGVVLVCGDQAGARDLIDYLNSKPSAARVIRYGLEGGSDWQAVGPTLNANGAYDFDLVVGGQKQLSVSLSVPGVHNVQNGLAALAVAGQMGIPLEQAAETLTNFVGVGRRFELKGMVGDILIIDDYAHHPTEIKATLAAARDRFPDRPIWAVLQPHTYSRTRALLDDFGSAFDDADHTIVLDIYAAREVDDGTVSGQTLVDRMVHPDARHIPSLEGAANYLVTELHPNAVLITMGAGDGCQVGELVLEKMGGSATRNAASTAGDCVSSTIERGQIDRATEALSAYFGGWLRRDEPMARHSHLGVGGPADLWLQVDNLEDLVEAIRIGRRHQSPIFLIGGGANLLISDRGIRGMVITNQCQGMEMDVDRPGCLTIETGAGLGWLSREVARRGLSGLEWAVGVPGTLGGAVVNNAGAHGGCVADKLVQVELLTPDGRREWQAANWFKYEYRSSRLKKVAAAGTGYVVLRACFQLDAAPRAVIEEKMAQYTARRQARQPSRPSLGSTFKNPPGDYAARLIEAAGLKGTQIGGALISTDHANFFVKRGEAQAADFAALIKLAQDTVKSEFGIDLELEIQKVGEWGE